MLSERYFLALVLSPSQFHFMFLCFVSGIPDEQDGLFAIIQRNKSQYQKRSYQCIKCLVALFSKCDVAMNELRKSADLRRKWALSVEWLQDELNRVSIRNVPFLSKYHSKS